MASTRVSLPGRRAASLVYGAYYGYLGIVTPFLPVWLDHRGVAAAAIAQSGGLVMILATIGQAAVPALAVRLGLHRMAVLAAALAAIGTGALVLAQGTMAIMATAALAGFFAGALLPLADATALGLDGADHGAGNGIDTDNAASLEKADADRAWGRVRAWGSLGFVAGSLASGWMTDRLGAASIVPGAAVALLLVLIGMLAGRHPPTASPPPGAGDAEPGPGDAEPGAALSKLLGRADLWLLILAVATINASHAYYYTFANLHWLADYGMDATEAGLLWAVGVAAEIAVFTWGATLVREDGSERRVILLLLAGGAAGAVRWGLTALDPPLPVLLALQLLHGLTFGATFLGGMAALRRMVPPRLLPPVLGIFAAMVHGVVIGGLTFALGGQFGPQGPQGFALMAGIAALGVVLVGTYAAAHHGLWRRPAR